MTPAAAGNRRSASSSRVRSSILNRSAISDRSWSSATSRLLRAALCRSMSSAVAIVRAFQMCGLFGDGWRPAALARLLPPGPRLKNTWIIYLRHHRSTTASLASTTRRLRRRIGAPITRRKHRHGSPGRTSPHDGTSAITLLSVVAGRLHGPATNETTQTRGSRSDPRPTMLSRGVNRARIPVGPPITRWNANKMKGLGTAGRPDQHFANFTQPDLAASMHSRPRPGAAVVIAPIAEIRQAPSRARQGRHGQRALHGSPAGFSRRTTIELPRESSRPTFSVGRV